MELTKNEAGAIAQVIDLCIFDLIRNDTEIDSIEWLYNVISGYKKLCIFGGYAGMTCDFSEREDNAE